MDIFNEQSAILVRKLSNELNKDSFNIFPYVTLCTLDIVCGKFWEDTEMIFQKLENELKWSLDWARSFSISGRMIWNFGEVFFWMVPFPENSV